LNNKAGNQENLTVQNYFLRIISTGFLYLLLCTIGWAQEQNLPQDNPLSDIEAESLVSTYLSALHQGDTYTIKQTLGGDLLEARGNLLDNPSYSNTLSRIYSTANSNITRVSYIDPQHIAVDAVIELNPDEILQCRFIVAKDENKQLKIVEETHYDN
jgi:hypothetical protein